MEDKNVANITKLGFVGIIATAFITIAGMITQSKHNLKLTIKDKVDLHILRDQNQH